jgi:hypothetical protein
MPQDPNYWFPTKRYGWGWGIPLTWQGWVVLSVFLVLLSAGTVIMTPHQTPVRFAGYVAILTVLLTAVCWWKGEPPRWRWGGK